MHYVAFKWMISITNYSSDCEPPLSSFCARNILVHNEVRRGLPPDNEHVPLKQRSARVGWWYLLLKWGKRYAYYMYSVMLLLHGMFLYWSRMEKSDSMAFPYILSNVRGGYANNMPCNRSVKIGSANTQLPHITVKIKDCKTTTGLLFLIFALLIKPR